MVRLPPPLIVNWPLSASPTPSSCDRVQEDPADRDAARRVVADGGPVGDIRVQRTGHRYAGVDIEDVSRAAAGDGRRGVDLGVVDRRRRRCGDGVELPSIVVQDDATPNGSLASVVFSQKRVRGLAGMASLPNHGGRSHRALTFLKPEGCKRA